jgi:hypothetical protein
MTSPKNIYRRFIALEEQAAQIYLNMASRFASENPELSALWLDMGIQEKEHAGLLQFCLCEEMFANALPTTEEARKLHGHFAALEKRAADPALTVQDAFKIAIDMEVCEVNTIYSQLTTPLHRSMYLLRRKILTSMPTHIERLLSAGRQFSVPATMLKKLERVAQKTA